MSSGGIVRADGDPVQIVENKDTSYKYMGYWVCNGW